MAKITLKSYEELIVREDSARLVFEMREEKKKEENSGGLPLSAWPITIEHEDGLWIGNLSNIGQISLSEKTKGYKYTFKSKEDLERFHNEYGYGAFEEYFQPHYGLVDIKTQFLIKIKQVELRGDNLIALKMNKEAQEKWMELWQQYENNLDGFNELKS